jgi:hypothetical protein
LLPEQVWDDQPPPGETPGTGTFSATTHAQLVRRVVARRGPAGRAAEHRRLRYVRKCSM